jgi:hypothetical protein
MCWSLWWRRSVENLKSLFGLGTRSRGAESLSQLIPVVPGLLVVSNGCVWKCCVPLNPMVLLIIIPFLNGYFIGNIPYFQTNPNLTLHVPTIIHGVNLHDSVILRVTVPGVPLFYRPRVPTRSPTRVGKNTHQPAPELRVYPRRLRMRSRLHPTSPAPKAALHVQLVQLDVYLLNFDLSIPSGYD